MTVESGTSTVRLTVPAKPEYVVLTRLALSAVCRLTPLQPEDVADLKLAITEAATGLVQDGSAEQLDVGFELRDDRLVLDVSGPAGGQASPEEQELGRAIIEATVDEYDYAADRVRLVKHLVPSDQ
jgi:anti-sigma regulatory factor (Ser/Thr protein kinase)